MCSTLWRWDTNLSPKCTFNTSNSITNTAAHLVDTGPHNRSSRGHKPTQQIISWPQAHTDHLVGTSPHMGKHAVSQLLLMLYEVGKILLACTRTHTYSISCIYKMSDKPYLKYVLLGKKSIFRCCGNAGKPC